MKDKPNPFHVSSLLFVPSISDRNLKAALQLEGACKPALLTFDLEDSVADEQKAQARENLLRHLRENSEFREKAFGSFQVRLRINPPGTPWYEDDLKAALEIRPHYIAIPKIESPQVIDRLRRQLGNEHIQFLVGIETLPGINRLPEILKAFTSSDGFVIGYEDLCAQLGIRRPRLLSEPSPLYYLICQALVHAKFRNIAVFDGMYRGVGSAIDLENLKAECAYSRKLGFDGKVAIHPKQVAIINEAFCKQAALTEAAKIVELLESRTGGKSVAVDENGEMIGPPARSFAERTIRNLGPVSHPGIGRDNRSQCSVAPPAARGTECAVQPAGSGD